MIEDVYLSTFAADWFDTFLGTAGQPSSTSASLLIFLPNVSISAQITSSLSSLTGWGVEGVAPWWLYWTTSVGIARYVQSPASSRFFSSPEPTTIEHIANCVAIQFFVNAGGLAYGNQERVNEGVSALATATIFIES